MAKRGDSVASGGASVYCADFLPDFERAGGGHPQSEWRFPRHIPEGGQQLIIPGILAAPIVEKPVPVARDFEVRAVYLTGLMAGSDHGMRIIRRWREVGGNAVVFDIKDSDGSVNIPFDHPLVGGNHTPYSRSAEVHALSAFAGHARDCAGGDFPRRTAGGGRIRSWR